LTLKSGRENVFISQLALQHSTTSIGLSEVGHIAGCNHTFRSPLP